MLIFVSGICSKTDVFLDELLGKLLEIYSIQSLHGMALSLGSQHKTIAIEKIQE